MGGWLCFVISIVWIGVLTAVIGDVASAFGCSVGLKDSVTAIAFVALGTSVPGRCRHGQNLAFLSFLSIDLFFISDVFYFENDSAVHRWPPFSLIAVEVFFFSH